MAKIIRLKNFFRQKEKPYSFKREHYLSQLPAHRLEEILLFSEGDHLSQVWPSFERKKILFFNDQKHQYIFKKILAAEPSHLVNYVYKGFEPTEQKLGYHTVYGDIDHLAIRKNYFDVVICPFALEDSVFVENMIKTLGAFLQNGSRVVFAARHPQWENMLYNQNPATTQVMEALVSKYFLLLRDNNFYTEDLREGCVDPALKTFFTDSEFDYYHEYKNTPISLMFKVVKFVKK